MDDGNTVQNDHRPRPLLIILGGLPATGKTCLARELARQIGAVHLRVDAIEQAMLASGVISRPLDDAGYRVGYAVAADNLRLGNTVIADSVNPLSLTREAWLAAAKGVSVNAIEVEVTCSDPIEHRRRVETRTSDIPGLKLPAWEEVIAREYQPWPRKHIVIDTAGRAVEQSVNMLRELISPW